MGNADSAFEWLERARQQGFDLAGYVGEDDDLNSLRSDARWTQLKQSARDEKTERHAAKGQAAAARGAGVVGVEISHSVRRDKLALALSLGSVGDRGWKRGSLGLPYYVSGHADTERRGWLITMHAAGTAVRPRQDTAKVPIKTQMGMGGR